MNNIKFINFGYLEPISRLNKQLNCHHPILKKLREGGIRCLMSLAMFITFRKKVNGSTGCDTCQPNSQSHQIRLKNLEFDDEVRCSLPTVSRNIIKIKEEVCHQFTTTYGPWDKSYVFCFTGSFPRFCKPWNLP